MYCTYIAYLCMYLSIVLTDPLGVCEYIVQNLTQYFVWYPPSTREHKPNNRQSVRESIQAPQTATVATNFTVDTDWLTKRLSLALKWPLDRVPTLDMVMFYTFCPDISVASSPCSIGGEVLYSLHFFCKVPTLWSLEPILNLFYLEEIILNILQSARLQARITSKMNLKVFSQYQIYIFCK